MKRYWVAVLAILWKDLLLELRTRDIVVSVLVFALLVLVIFNFAIEPGSQTKGIVAPGVLWVAFSFAGVLGLTRVLVLEKDRGCLEGLMLCPVDRDVIYVGKVLATLAFMLVVEAVSLPIFGVLFNFPVFQPRLMLIAVLATLGFVAVGTIFSAISVNTRSREIMLPMLFFPVVVPVLIAAVKASGAVLAGEPWGEITTWLQVLVIFDVVFLGISFMTFQFVLEE